MSGRNILVMGALDFAGCKPHSHPHRSESPPDERRQAHEIGLRVRVGLEAELRPPIIDEVELDVPPALHEQALPGRVIERGVLATCDDLRVNIEETLPDALNERKIG